VVVRVEFHTDIADAPGYTCRLLRKAYRRGLKAVVTGDAERLNRLDVLLWTFEQLEFVPHVRLRRGEQPQAALARTPIWLADDAPVWPAADLVVNLGDGALREPERFERVIEIVGDDEAERHAGRARWRHYTAAGLKPVHANATATANDNDASS